MKKINAGSFPRRAACGLLIVSVLDMAPAAWAGEFKVNSETILRIFERENTQNAEVTVAPLYEYLQADYQLEKIDGISLHGYGWGRADAGEGGFFEDDAAGELLYGYAEYINDWNEFSARLGRQHIFGGVTNDSLDGLSLQSELTSFFTLTAYGGQPVGLDEENGTSGDNLFGGRIEHHLGTLYKLGASYKLLKDNSQEFEKNLGLDLGLTLPGGVSLYGLSTRNLTTKQWAEHSYDVRINLRDLFVHPFFQRYQYEDYFNDNPSSPGPFRYLAGTGEELTVTGCDVSWHKSLTWETALEVRNYDYSVRGDGSQFYSAQLNWFGDDRSQAGGELGYMDGNVPENSYLLARAFVFLDLAIKNLKPGFASADLMMISYDQEIYGTDTATFASLGLGSIIMDDRLKLTITVDYQNDPYFEKDVRGMFVTSYQLGKRR